VTHSAAAEARPPSPRPLHRESPLPAPPTVRRATSRDGQVLLDLVDALADYERLPRPDPAARERLLRDAFERQWFDAYLVELAGRAIGYAIAFETYSSFLARPTLFLEDVFVLPEHRRAGVGSVVMRFLAGEALRRDCGRMEWMVLTWNEPALRFYDKLGATRLADWTAYRLTREELERFAGGEG
jgi:GNAT superfamily N-acetyltransferase